MPTTSSAEIQFGLLLLGAALCVATIGGVAIGAVGPVDERPGSTAANASEVSVSETTDVEREYLPPLGTPGLTGKDCDDVEERPAEDVSGRELVDDTEESPYSAIGRVTSDGDTSGTGFLVTDYHVITSAHVVTDEDADVFSGIEFTPGYDAPPDGSEVQPFGTAQVEDVTVPSDWSGGFDGDVDPPDRPGELGEFLKDSYDDLEDAQNDMALLELDRPIGAATGTMEFDSYEPSLGRNLVSELVWDTTTSSEYEGTFEQAGYPCGIEGTRLTTSNPVSGGTAAGLHVFTPTNLMGGDSGSPLWHVEDGDPVAVSVTVWDGWAARFSEDRLELFQNEIQSDVRPDASTEVDIVGEGSLPLGGHPDWADDHRSTPDTVLSHRQEVSLEATMYNDGLSSSVPDGSHPREATPKVEFFVSTESHPDPEDSFGTVCTDRSVPGVKDQTRVGCTGTLEALYEEDLTDADELYFHAYVDHSAASDDHSPRRIGSAENDAETAGSPALDVVDLRSLHHWVDPRWHLPPIPSVNDPGDEIDLEITVNNKGLGEVPVSDTAPIPEEALAKVVFHASSTPHDYERGRLGSICSDRVAVELLGEAVANCTGTLEGAVDGDLDEYERLYVFAEVDHSTASDDHEPGLVGIVPIETEDDGLSRTVDVASVDHPDEVRSGESYEVAATVTGDEILEASSEIAFDPDLGRCTPERESVTLEPDAHRTVETECTVPEGSAGDTVELAVSTDDDEATADLPVTGIDYDADVRLDATDYEYSQLPSEDYLEVEVGDDYLVSATLENVGSDAGKRRVAFWSDAECAHLDGGEFEPLPLEEVQDTTTVSLEPGESTEVGFYCDMPVDGWLNDAGSWSSTLLVQDEPDDTSPIVDKDHELYEYVYGFSIVERQGPPSFEVEAVDVPATPTVGESVRVTPTVTNVGGPGSGTVQLLADGEVVDEFEGHVNRNEEFGLYWFDYEPEPEHAGETNLTVAAGDDAESVTVDVQPAPVEVEFESVPETVVPATETFDVTATVANDGDVTADRPVDLVVDGDTVDDADVSVPAGEAATVSLSGTVPSDAAGEIDLRLESGVHAAETAVEVDPPETSLEIVDAPKTSEPDGDYIVDVLVSNEDDRPAPVAVQVDVDDRDWMTLTTDVLEPGETETVRIWSILPEDVEAGDTLDVRVETATDADDTTVSIESRIEWISDISAGTVRTSPTVVNDTVFVEGESSLHALDTEDGDERWHVDASNSGIGTAPTVYDGTVFVADEALFAVDAATGEREWRRELDSEGSVYSPTVSEGTVYVAMMELHAVDAVSGEVLWTYNRSSQFVSSPTVVDGTVYAGLRDGEVVAVDAETGEEQWRYEEPSDSVYSAPTVADTTVYFGSHDETLYAVDAETGEEQWRYDEPTDTLWSSPTVANGTVLVGSSDGTLHAVDAGTGAERWQFEMQGYVGTSSPTVANGTVYAGAAELYAVDLETGLHDWSVSEVNAHHSSPTVVDGIVYVSSRYWEEVYAVDADHDASSQDTRVEHGTIGHVGDRASDDLDVPVIGDQYEPRPYGGDGLYRDVTGDGSLDDRDVTVFFENFHRQAMDRPELFDFSGNGRVSHGDVVALFQLASTG